MAQQQQRRFSTRDEVYLNSPGFESFMVAGMVFAALFTAIFIYSIKAHSEWMVWPGIAIAGAACLGTLKFLQRREYQRKLAELEAEQEQLQR